MIDYESCVDDALFQLGLGEDFDEWYEPNKVTNRGDDSEIPGHIADAGGTGDKNTTRFQAPISGGDDSLRIFEQVQEVVRQDDVVEGFLNV
jgi:hypothetical protein